MKTVTFDFDNTIAMSYMDFDSDPPDPVFQAYNDPIIEKIKKNIKKGNEVFLVTSRQKHLEEVFPDQCIPFHLERLGLADYFLPNRLFYTDGAPKKEVLKQLGTEKHYDDDILEHYDAIDEEYSIKQPLEHFEDSDSVGKIVIFDAEDNILLLQRSDSGNYWDLPGGHIKNIEISRGPDGLKDGSEREIFEETGLLVPFLKEFDEFDLIRKGITHRIIVFLSKLDTVKPHVRLDLQEKMENIDYKWIKLSNLEPLMTQSTINLRKIHDKLVEIEKIFEQNEPFQRKMKEKHKKMKKKLIGMGKNKHFGGGKGHKRPKMARSKSAPPVAGLVEEEKWPEEYFKERKLEKKVKIKVKIVKNLDEKRKKRKKRRKKRRKSYKYGRFYPYFGGHTGHYEGDFGGDGGSGGE